MSIEPETGPVSGERGPAVVDRRYSAEARFSTFMAVGLMSALGLGVLTWYYAKAMSHTPTSNRNVPSAAARAAQIEPSLPPLGRIDPPSPWRPDVSAPEIPLSPGPRPWLASPTVVSTDKTPEQLELERRLSGAAFSATASSAGHEHASSNPPSSRLAMSDGPDYGEGLERLLRPQTLSAVEATRLPTQRLLLPKGAFIDCTLETAIDSTLPGMTTCIVATDTFSADGTVVLLERGTKLVGETRGQVQQGSARVFVVWDEARTPSGVVIALSSPGTDELGRAGLPGTVNRHFLERFGAAILISTIDGAVQSVSRSSGAGTVIYNPSTVQDVMTEVLKGTINIPPTVTKRQGDRIQVLVARDLDFRTVYELRTRGSAR